MHDTIRQFQEEYRFLSNFYPVTMTYDNITYPSSEHAYQAQKCAHTQDKLKFIDISAGQAKRLGRKVECVSTWNDDRLRVMYNVLKVKFSNNELKRMLLDTGNKFIIEGNNWNDSFWGFDLKKQKGENNLGAILMQIRNELVEEAALLPQTYFCSDLHFRHSNIIMHCKRPCTEAEHDNWILSIVSDPLNDNDTMYHLGDFMYGKRVKLSDLKDIISKLRGTWKFIIGNHDNIEQLRAACKGTRHEVIGYYDSFRVNNIKMVLCHYPFENWDCMRYGAVHLHGHLHDSKPNTLPNRYNVCLDFEHRIYNLTEFVGN